MGVQSVLRAFEIAATVVGWLSVGLLVAAAVVHTRRAIEQEPAPVSLRARLCQLAVGLPVLVGVVSALVLDVPLAYGWGSVAAVALVALLLRRDERFWAALAILLPIFTLTGLVLMAALANNLVAEDGSGFWYGGRQLQAWGGLHANPTYPHWEWTVVALAVTRYGLPLSLIVATSWLATVRGAMTRTERLGLVTAGQSLLAAVAIGATFSIVVLGAGLLQGLPVHFVVLGVLGSLFTLVTVGPGAVGGVIVEGRTLRARVPTPAQGAYTLVSSIDGARDPDPGGTPGDAGEDRPVWRSLLGFLTGELSGLKRLNLVLLALFGGLVALVALSSLLGDGLARSRPVHFEYIEREMAVGFVVGDAHPVAEDVVWLVGEDRVAVFDPTEGSIDHIDDLAAAAATVEDGRLLVLTRETRPRLIAIDPRRPDRREELTRLDREVGGRMAVTADDVYVIGAGNRLHRFDRDTGTLGARVGMEYDDPVDALFLADVAIITVQQDDRFGRRFVRRDLDTLEATHDADDIIQASVAVFADGGRDPRLAALVRGDALGDTRHHEDFSRVLVDHEGRLRWWAHGLGALHRLRGGEPAERHDFHYDSINGVFETRASGTWLLVDDDQGSVLDRTAPRQTHLALWQGPELSGDR